MPVCQTEPSSYQENVPPSGEIFFTIAAKLPKTGLLRSVGKVGNDIEMVKKKFESPIILVYLQNFNAIGFDRFSEVQYCLRMYSVWCTRYGLLAIPTTSDSLLSGEGESEMERERARATESERGRYETDDRRVNVFSRSVFRAP